MEYDDYKKIVAFDTLFSTNHIQMLKILLPYLDLRLQKSMAVYIKFMELNYTIRFYQKHPTPLFGRTEKEPAPELPQICSELLPFCDEKEKKQMEQIKSLFGSMKMYQDILNTVEMMKELMPDFDMNNVFNSTGNSADTTATGNPDIMNLLMNLLSPEQKEMFDLFGGDFHE